MSKLCSVNEDKSWLRYIERGSMRFHGVLTEKINRAK